jgi:CheY-like chemotaxis protein
LSLTLPVSRVATVLVVDDNPDVCLLFQRYLDRTYRVIQAHSATEALALLRDARPEVVTLDVLMPSADGWELLQQIRADPATRDVPVIICSVVRDDSLALSLGATELLPKPISREGLRSALERCLRSRA